MIKTILTTVLLLIGSVIFGQSQGNYIVVINNDSIHIDLKKEKQYKTASGEDLTIKILQPDILTFKDDMISFNYAKSLSISKTEISPGIDQYMVMQSTGNGFIIQKYKTMDPTGLTQLMLNQITKRTNYNDYTRTEKPFKRELSSGQTIEGIQAILTNKNEELIYTVATYGADSEGIVVITMLLNENFKDEHIIELFLNTLTIK